MSKQFATKGLVFIYVLLLLLSFQNEAAHQSKRPATNAAQYGLINGVSYEPLARLDIPEVLIREQLEDLLKASGILKTLRKFRLDPVRGTLQVSGEVNLPSSLLLSMQSYTGGMAVTQTHHFDLIIGFPTTSTLANKEGYVKFDIIKLAFDGVDFSKAFNIVSSVAPYVLSNPSLIRYLIDDEDTSLGSSKIQDENDPVIRMQHLVEAGAFTLTGNTINIKFNLKEFNVLNMFSVITENLKLWHFRPVLIRGTKTYTALRIEAGVGMAHASWKKQSTTRELADAESIKKNRKEHYIRYQSGIESTKKLKGIIEAHIIETGITIFSEREKRNLKHLQGKLEARMFSELSIQDYFFALDPEEAYSLFFDNADTYSKLFIRDLVKRRSLEAQRLAGGIDGNSRPVIVQRISQAMLDQLTNYFGNMTLRGDRVFDKLFVRLAPHIPGLIVRGNLRADLNTYLRLALSESAIDFGDQVVRLDPTRYGDSYPFELALYLSMKDSGVLEIDVRNGSIGTGDTKLSLFNFGANGDFLASIAKMILADSLSGLLPDVLEPMIGGPEAKRRTREQRRKIYQRLIKYNQDSGRLEVSLDPKNFVENVMETSNDLQLWNIETVYDKKLNEAYLEVAIGRGERTKEYIKYIRNRDEYRDGQFFSGAELENPKANIDVSISANLSEISMAATKILRDISNKDRQKVLIELNKPQDGRYFFFDSLSIAVLGDHELSFNGVVSMIEKKKKGALTGLFSGDAFKQTESTIQFSTVLELKSSSLKGIHIPKVPGETQFDHVALAVDLKRGSFNYSGGNFLFSLAEFFLGKIDTDRSRLEEFFKKALFTWVRPYLNPKGAENENLKLAGISMNKFIKAYVTPEAIYLQLSPRIVTKAIDILLVPKDEFNKVEIGMDLDPKGNAARLDFHTVMGLSPLDNWKLEHISGALKNMASSIQGMTPSSFAKHIKSYSLYQDLFWANDLKNKSAYHQFLEITQHYHFTSLSRTGEALPTQDKTTSILFSCTGLELLKVSKVSADLMKVMDVIINRVKLELPVAQDELYFKKMLEIQGELQLVYHDSLIKYYLNNNYLKNQQMVKRGKTDWNAPFIEEARLAESLRATLSFTAWSDLKGTY